MKVTQKGKKFAMGKVVDLIVQIMDEKPMRNNF